MSLTAVLWLLAAFALSPSTGSGTNGDELLDAIRAISLAPKLLLLAATKYDPMLECLDSDLTALNASAGTATYTWHVRGKDGQTQQDIPVDYVINKDSPDRGVAFMNSDTSNPIPAVAVYADYKTCIVDKMLLGSEELCLQWVTPGTEKDVPEACNSAFKEKCGGGTVLYKDDACK